ncbi:hypothetical protein TIFTF001_028993 [Ficus carica]|uniref:J domain-containing protein n=1 Tax=Ficus carica TaxID=3494 RepID=A0AA88J1V0_FICCA|nr:hypothetical protein TIFTF001_028993 [Ficus carica]
MAPTLTLPNLFFSPESFLLSPRPGGGASPSSSSASPRLPSPTTVRAFTATETATRRRTNSLYEVLRVKRNASATEIKTAYRSLAKLYHPDASLESESESDFIALHNAYATLSDPAARATYDLSLGRPYYSTMAATSPYSSSSPASAFGSGFYSTRRWETDQCW